MGPRLSLKESREDMGVWRGSRKVAAPAGRRGQAYILTLQLVGKSESPDSWVLTSSSLK